ncbi:MAG: efflux RND transporter periplasmic adaptor subunit [Cyanobacteria bacterium NC_groundwater_1444_Ag_S-0.65um_54_12]|nr:efflux RND transporter periplasmic adaptor subunit [Cyanobacteria bacterium NC_groundwater_1444_Ag_S-0.65um_54_12]
MMVLLLPLLLAVGCLPAQAAPEPRMGTVFPQTEIPIIVQAGGKVEQLRISEGERVQAGQLLLSVEHSQFTDEIRLLEMQIRNRAALRIEQLTQEAAKQDLARDEALFIDRNLPLKTLQDTRNRARLAVERVAMEKERLQEQEQALAIKRKTLRDFAVLAPIGGVMVSVLLHANQMITPGTKLGDLLQVDPVLVETFVPWRAARRLKIGEHVVVRSPGDDADLPGRIKVIGEKVDPVTASLKVRIQVPNSRQQLKPGMVVRVLL